MMKRGEGSCGEEGIEGGGGRAAVAATTGEYVPVDVYGGGPDLKVRGGGKGGVCTMQSGR